MFNRSSTFQHIPLLFNHYSVQHIAEATFLDGTTIVYVEHSITISTFVFVAISLFQEVGP